MVGYGGEVRAATLDPVGGVITIGACRVEDFAALVALTGINANGRVKAHRSACKPVNINRGLPVPRVAGAPVAG